MSKMHAVIVVLDGLRADAVAAYGNARAETPFLDRLAAESIVFDFAFCLDPTIEGFYTAAAAGIHPWYVHTGTANAPSLASTRPLSDAARLCCYTDDLSVAEFHHGRFRWSSVAQFTASADTAVDEQPYAADDFFRAAAAWLNDCFASPEAASPLPTIGWVHSSLLTVRAYGPDARAARESYAAQVTRLDAAVRDFFTSLSFPDEAEEMLFIVTGSRGYAFGERGMVGVDLPALNEELLHVPLILYISTGMSDACRVARLISPLGLYALLTTRLVPAQGTDASDIPAWDSSANCLFFANWRGDRAVRTPSWCLLRTTSSGEPEHSLPLAASQAGQPGQLGQLYLKPDDRWEFNEISDRVPAVAQVLAERLEAFGQRVAAGQPPSVGPLTEELLRGA